MLEIGSRLTVTLPMMGKAEVKMLNGKMISTRIPRDDCLDRRGPGLRATMRVLIAALCMLTGSFASFAQETPATVPATQPEAAPTPPVVQPEALPAEPPATQAAPDAAAPVPPAAPVVAQDIRFNFKGATYRQVIDFFSRATGLPVVWESDVPEGTLDYVSPEGYAMPEALKVLNIVLQSKGVMLRVDGEMLYLQKLAEMARENIPTFTGTLPGEITDDQIVTIVLPLKIALAKNLAEKLNTMVNAAYGSVAAMEQQNSLMITETAGQVRRLLAILTQLDQADPDGVVEIFPIKHAKASTLMTPLKALLSQRVEKYVINQQGQQVKLEEDQMPGLTISSDDRTNAIIAKGAQNRIDQLKQAIDMLDVPAAEAGTGAGAGRIMHSAMLTMVAAQDVANRLRQLFERGGDGGERQQGEARVPRPTIIALDEVSKIIIFGSETQVAEAKALIRELEGETAPPPGTAASTDQPNAEVIELQRADARAVAAAVQSMLTRRQAAVMKLAPGPDNKSILVTGLPGDIASVRALAQAMDRQAAPDKQVRQVRIASGDPVKIVDQARKLFDEQSTGLDENARALSIEVDPEARLVTAVGSARAVEQFTATLRMIESNVTVDREARRITLATATPSEVAVSLAAMAQPLLQPSDGSTYIAPTFTPVDALKTIVITATPQQMAVLESLAASLDAPELATPAMPALRILQLRIVDAGSIAAALMNQYAARSPAEKKAKPVNIVADFSTNSLLVAAHESLLPEIQAMVEELNTVERAADLEGREIRIFPLKVARAEQLAKTIDEMYPAPAPPLDVRGRPQPQLAKAREVVVRADAQTNSLIVDAPVQRMAGFQQLVEQLDRAQILVETQVRTYHIAHANLDSIAETLRQLAASNALGAPNDQRVPISVTTESVSKAIVVSGPAEIFARVESVLKELDAQRTGPATTLRFFTLTNAKAETIAEMLRSVLLTRIAQDIPEAKNEAATLLNVTSDRKTNTLIISAPEAIMPVAETLIKQLDSGSVSLGDPIVRVKPLTFADAGTVSQALTGALPSMVSKTTGEPVSVKLFAAPGSNAIIMVGLEPELAEVEALIEPLDARPATDSMDAKTFALQHADATKIAMTVQNLLNDQQETDPRILLERIRASRGQLNLTPKIRVEADARTNSLIVSGPQQTVALAETLITQLDAPDDQSQRISMIFTAKNAGDVNVLAANVKRVMDATRQAGSDASSRSAIEIIAEPQSRAIVVIGPEAEAQRAIAMLGERDASALSAPQIDMRLIAVKNAQPDLLAQVIQSLLRDQSRWPEELRSIAAAGITIAQPSVLPDVAGSRLLISGPTQLMTLASQLTAELDQPRADDADRSVQVLTLINADAAQLATSLDSLFADEPAARKPVIRVDVASNSLLVRANQSQFASVEQVVKRVDQAAVASGRQMKIVPLDPARSKAGELAAAIKQMLGRDGADGGGGATVEVMTLDELLGSDDAKPQASPGAGSQSMNVTTVVIASVLATFQDAPPEPKQDAGGADVTIAVDEATNSLILLGSPRSIERLTALIKQMQEQMPAMPGKIRSIALPAELDAKHIAAMITQTLAKYAPASGVAGDLAKRVSVLADGPSNALIVAANDVDFAIVRDLIAAFAKPPEGGREKFPVRTLTLQRAPASSVAQAVQQFYDRRAALQARNREGNQSGAAATSGVAIMAVDSSNTILVAANDKDFEDVQKLVEQFDVAEAAGVLTFKVFELKHARAMEIERTVQELVNDLLYNQPDNMYFYWPPQRSSSAKKDTIAVKADARLNTLIVTGRGDKFDLVEQMIEILDAAPPQGAERLVKLYRPRHAPMNLVADMISAAFNASRQRRPWETPDPTAISVRADENANVIMISASEKEHEQIATMIRDVDAQLAEGEVGREAASGPEAITTKVLAVKFARAGEIAQTLTRFLTDRAKATNASRPRITIAAAEGANSLIIAASEADFAQVEAMLAQLDQPDVAGDRSVEIIALQHGDATEIARILKEQFGRRASGQAAGVGVVVTADPRTNSVIVNAPAEEFAQAQALISRLDSPPASDETIIRTYALKGAQATEAMRILQQTLQLDARGRTPGKGISVKVEGSEDASVEIKATVVADRRSNSLVVTATEASFPVIESLIKKLEEVPAASPVEWRIVRLDHALASEVSWTLNQVGRSMATDAAPAPRVDYNRVENQLVIAATADQFKQLDAILQQIDQPSPTQRTTDFVPLKFAEAEKVQEALSIFYGSFAAEADTPGKRNTRIVADPATNSLVISAGKDEWDGIRSLLEKLDSEQYDASLQLKVLPLKHADAPSVARAVNDAFSGQVMGDQRSPGARPPNQPRPRAGGQNDPNRADDAGPTLLVENEDWVRASAEPQTNSVIVSASRKNLAKVEEIITQLDVADYATLPAPRIIPIKAGDPMQMATALQALYEQSRSGGGGANQSRRATRIVGNAASNAIIVRAEDDEFAQIQMLADSLQEQASSNGLLVSIVRLNAAPATRVATAITDAYSAKAKQLNQPLSIKVDATGNNLIVAAPGPIAEEIKATAAQLDGLAPAAGQGIFIIDLQNITPESAKTIIETIGLDKKQPEDSNSRIVVEPIKVSLMPGRNSIIIVGNPADRDTLVQLLQSIDAAPAMAEAQVIVVPLKNSQAAAVATLLTSVLKPGEQQADTPLAKAIREQVRRLSVHKRDAQDKRLELDLTKPVKVTAEPQTNSLIVSSTYENVMALEEIIAMFDRLPITDAVTVQIFPLQNIAADQFSRIVKELFTQGKTLGKVGRTNVVGEPEGVAGKALLNEIAISTDERTNSIIVAGTEDAVALVEVMRTRLDNEMSSAWVEPRVLPLRFADATELATTLDAILVQGIGSLPQSNPLQKQVARLRMARLDGNGGQVLESDVFTPMSRLVIKPETQLNALILVGTPANIEVVSELVAMLDIEAASPADAVRIYPLVNASASRLATTIKTLFDQQVQSKSIRPEDRVIVQGDERTNALVVATSPRSFAVLENLLSTLDVKLAPELSELKQIELKNAAAPRLATLIQQLMDTRSERLKRVSPETADLERAMIVADARTNSLVVAAGPESFEIIKQLATDLDTSNLGDAALIRVLPIVGGAGNIDRLATTINQIMQRRYADLPADLRNSQRPLVMTDARTNALLVAANPEDFAAIEDLVNKLAEAPLNPAVDFHVIALGDSTRAELLAPRLQKLMQDRAASLGPAAAPSDRVSVEPDLASNSLIVAASEENMNVVRGLIDMLVAAEREASGLDANVAGPRDVEFVPLTSASRATDIVDLLQDLYIEEANRTRGQNIVRVTADERINAVLINAPASDVRAIKNLIAQLDGARPANVVEIKYVPLTSANAVETVSLIENVLSGRGIGARRNPRQATVLKYLRQMAKGETDPAAVATQPDDADISDVEMQVSAAIRESITLTPDLRTNTIIVAAPRESIGMIEQMIRDLDSSSIGSKNIRIFKLTNADAIAMAEILADLFRLRQGNSMYVLKPREDGGTAVQPMAGGADAGPAPSADNVLAGLSGTDLTAVPDERQQLSITVDSRTNSLIVSGTPTYLDLVAQVVQDLDALEANEREIYVYQLRNAVAADVARVVSEFVDTEQTKLIGTLSPDQLGSAARLLEREITIKGDDASNTVLVSASPRYMERLKEIIRQLDVDPPQVLIQVMLAEVTIDSRDDWGVNMRAAFDVGSTTIGGGYGLARAFVPGLGVPNISIASDDFNLLIRALKSQGRLQVLSNPSIMAANNSPARIQVGETVRLPAFTAVSDSGQTSTTLEKEELGVILEVTPSINPDGFVRMKINPEISNLSQRTTQVSEDFSSPIITRRNADTTVTVQDGQTIVIGGLISDRFERRDRKVPFFGDLPLIGPLFRSNTEETAKTELLIVLTPHVIESPAHFDRVDQVTKGEIDRLSLPESVKEQIRKGMLEGSGGLFDSRGNPIRLREEDEEAADENPAPKPKKEKP